MQESFSITGKWDTVEVITAIMWAISHVITNIHERVESDKQHMHAWQKALNSSLLIEPWCLTIMCVSHVKRFTLTCGRFSLQWSRRSVICRWSLAVSGRSSTRALEPEKDTKTQASNTLHHVNDHGCGQSSHLCVSAGIPVRVIDYDSVGSCQINSQAPDFSGQQEDKNGIVL